MFSSHFIQHNFRPTTEMMKTAIAEIHNGYELFYVFSVYSVKKLLK